MAQVGRLGNIRFSTSDKRILTFDNFKVKKTTRTATHNTIGTKPRLERVGPGLDTLTFKIDLLASLGVHPRAEAEKIENKLENGATDYLMIGNKRVGRHRWTITAISSGWEYIYSRGEVAKISMELTLTEYL